MTFYKPIFSIVVIFIQLILSIKDYFELQKWRQENSGLDGIISLFITYDTLFIFVLIIGVYEMIIKPSRFKTIIRIFLVCIILGTQFASLIPIDDFYFGVYNTAWFSAVVAFVLILAKFGKYIIESINNRKPNNTQKASR